MSKRMRKYMQSVAALKGELEALNPAPPLEPLDPTRTGDSVSNTPPKSRRFFLEDEADSYVNYAEENNIKLADCYRSITWYMESVSPPQKLSERKRRARLNIKKFKKVHQLLDQLMNYWEAVLKE